MQYWISYSNCILSSVFGHTNECYVESSNLALREGDIRILCANDTIIGEELVCKSHGGWNLLQPTFYLFPIPFNRLFTEGEIRSLKDGIPKKITDITYRLVKEIENLLFAENIDIHPSQISDKRLHKKHRLERIYSQQEIVSRLLSDISSHILICEPDDYIKTELLPEPPEEIRYFLPNHGAKRLHRRTLRP